MADLDLNRGAFQRLARIRLADAQVLLKNRRYDAAYYLAGYAVECALKACIAKQTYRHQFPGKEKVCNSYTHVLRDLAKLASSDLDKELSGPGEFYEAWGIVKEWSEISRYRAREEAAARRLIAAVRGVLRCIRKYW